MEKNNKDDKKEMKSMSPIMDSDKMAEFSTQFKISEEGLVSLSTQKTYAPDQVRIVNFYRFEGESDPDDNSILYAIETFDGEKCTLVDAYGMYSDPLVSDFIEKVEEINK